MSDDYRTMFDSDYIGIWDLVGKDGKPRDFTLVIEKVRGAELTVEGGKKKRNPVISFRGATKEFVANKTNARAIAGMYGSRTSGWVGKSVTLYGDPSITFGKKVVGGVRIRPTIPKGKADAELPSQPVDPAMRQAQNDARSEAARTEAERSDADEGP